MSSELFNSLVGLRDIQNTRYAELVSSTIIVFEHFITLGDEKELIWESSWTAGKALFFINRYYTLFCVILNNYALFSSHLTDEFCLRFMHWQGWTGLVGCMIAEVILQMRLYALYFLDRKILILMATCFVLTSAAAATIMGIVLSQVSALSRIPGTDVHFCIPFNIPKYFFAFWIPILSFETLLCVLALIRGFQTFRSSGGLFQSGRRLVSTLVRDSLLYFLVIFATYLTNLLVWSLARENLIEIPIGFAIAMSCVLCNRIIFNVRRAKKEVGLSQELPSQETKDTTVDFYTPTRASFPIEAGVLTEIEMMQIQTLSIDSTHGFVAYAL